MKKRLPPATSGETKALNPFILPVAVILLEAVFNLTGRLEVSGKKHRRW